jgi:RHS repeat-associated protein
MPNDFKYVGEQLDPNSGFYYNRARWYDSRVGRFASVDPFRGRVGVPMSQHRYLYAEQSPINKSDPTGRIVDYNLNSTSAAAAINGILEAGVGAAQRIAGRSLWKWFLGRLVIAATTLTGDSWDDAQQRAWQNEARKESPVRLQHYTTDVGHGAILRDGVIKPMSGRVYLTPDFYSDPNEATEKLATCDKREWAVSLKVYSGADKLAPITEVQPYPCSDGRRPGGGRETSTTNPIYFGIMRETIIWWPLTD